MITKTESKAVNQNSFFKLKPYLHARYRSQVINVEPTLLKGDRHSHDVQLVKKKPPTFKATPENKLPNRYRNLWFLKENDYALDSVIEVIAQECFRLLIPNQPKTRLVQQDDTPTKLYVMSKGIPGFTAFKDIDPDILLHNLKNQIYCGLGDVLIASLLLNECDLHLSNIGVDSQGQVLKIDGEKCFAEYQFIDQGYDIVLKDLQTLPKISVYNADNWIGQISYADEFLSIWDKYDFSQDENFCQEVNQAILRAILVPEPILFKCIEDCIPKDLYDTKIEFSENSFITVQEAMSTLYQELLHRQHQLEVAAMQLPGFRDYLLSPAAQEHLEDYFDYLSTYTTISNNDLNLEPNKIWFLDKLGILLDQLDAELIQEKSVL